MAEAGTRCDYAGVLALAIDEGLIEGCAGSGTQRRRPLADFRPTGPLCGSALLPLQGRVARSTTPGRACDLPIGATRGRTKALRDEVGSSSVRRELLTLHAEQCQQAGWAAFDAGWHDVADKYYYRRSHAAADEAGDAGARSGRIQWIQTSLIACRGKAAERLFEHVAKAFDPVATFRTGDPVEAAKPDLRPAWTEQGRVALACCLVGHQPPLGSRWARSIAS